ncbi:DMT family transporter [Massilia glaciei]|uniref:EamA/RhaT family transporter n=1 Tax=Massilia glaciei TaxID=1524097 RepID=A0A2U2HJI7_9BURK|nr:DMT family transporter [Massilia glaciei]PWF47670.1 EamA/RhaT family transporter [Massilia glaciei]
MTPSTVLLLTVPPLLWAGNAVVGRLVRDAVSPMTLNLLRWSLALLILLPLGRALLRPGSGWLTHWRRLCMLGLLSIGLYNSLQYLALRTSTPINVTLVAAGMPVWMLLVGALFFGAGIGRRQVLGALLSVAGVLLVLCRGDWQQLLALRLVAGDLYMILATISFSFYSWMLAGTREPQQIRADWAAFLLAQVGYGVLWSGLFTGAEWAAGSAHVEWSWALAAALLYVAVGPAVIAMGCWGEGVRRAGPGTGAFFTNLTPLFAALMSSAFLGELPHLYHMLAFAMIVAGIAASAPRAT